MTDIHETGDGGETLSALLHESRQFDPPPGFAAQANAQPDIYEEAAEDPQGWWALQAERLQWDRHWDRVLEWDLPFAKWFVGGTLNASVNCVDRHVTEGRGEKVAFHWVGEPENATRKITYADLQVMVCQAANALVLKQANKCLAAVPEHSRTQSDDQIASVGLR